MNKKRRWLSGFEMLLILLALLLVACAEQGGDGVEELAAPEPTEEIRIEQDPTGGEVEVLKPGQQGVVTIVDEDLPPIIPDTTKVVEEATMQSLDGISPEGTFTFVASTADAEAFLLSVQAGHVLAGGVTDLAPEGFLRRVMTVSRNGSQFVIETAEATLEEAIEQGVVEINEELTLDDLAAVQPAEKRATVAKARPGLAPGAIVIDIPDTELADNVTADGTVEVKPKFNFKVVVKNHQIESVLFSSEMNEEVALRLRANLAHAGVKSSKEFAPYRFKTFTVWVGVLPVVIRPELAVVVGANGDVSADISTNVVHSGNMGAVVRYDKINDWTVETTDFDPEYDFDPPHLTTNANLKAFAGPRLKLLIYNVPGPYAQMDGYLELIADLLKTPWWEFYGGLEAEVGVKVKILGYALLSYSQPIIDKRWPIADAGGPAPGVSGVPPPDPAVESDGDSGSDGDGSDELDAHDPTPVPTNPPPATPVQADPTRTPQAVSSTRCLLTEDVNVRAYPGLGSDNIIGTILGGERVPVSGWTRNPGQAVWYLVPLDEVTFYERFRNDPEGWISMIGGAGQLLVDCSGVADIPELP